MIVTVTMNPAIDKTIYVDKYEYGEVNFISSSISNIGGKGINVSKAIKELGGESIVIGFLGGEAGGEIERDIQKYGIKSEFIHIQGNTRTNLKVVEKKGMTTAFNELGPIITEDEMAQLIEKIDKYAKEDTLFVFAGSLPRGVDDDCYKKLIERVHAKGSKVFLDTQGKILKVSLDAQPEYIKPNRLELETYFDMDYRADEKELIYMASKLLNKGIKLIAVSLGPMGAFFLTKDKKIKCPGIVVKANSTSGCGDAMVGALAYCIDKGDDFVECAKLSIATSAAATTTNGTIPPSIDDIDELYAKVGVMVL